MVSKQWRVFFFFSVVIVNIKIKICWAVPSSFSFCFLLSYCSTFGVCLTTNEWSENRGNDSPLKSQLFLSVWKTDKQEMTDVACQLKSDWKKINFQTIYKTKWRFTSVGINVVFFVCFVFVLLQTTYGVCFLMLSWSSSLKSLWMLSNMPSLPNSTTSLQM